MNYAEARKRSDGCGWAFTVRNDDDIWTAPSCRVEGGDHHQHPTRRDAEDCFNSWRCSSSRITMDGEFADWTGCAKCDAPTKQAARHHDLDGVNYIPLCSDHFTIIEALCEIEDVTRMVYS